MANLDSTNDDKVCSVLWEADELLSADSADLSDDLKGALLKRLIVLRQCTDSGVALCRIARVWTQMGDDAKEARKMLVRAEEEPVDYDGVFDDFEEEDSFRDEAEEYVQANWSDQRTREALLETLNVVRLRGEKFQTERKEDLGAPGG